jgi:glycosyltransferase involved in cell wall biosynthesis
MKFFIVTENLRVGGIQRLALDECYALASKGIPVELITLSPRINGDDVIELDGLHSGNLTFKLTQFNKSRISKIINFRKILAKEKSDFTIVSHSASAVLLIRIAFPFRKKTKPLLYVHQLISMSGKFQAMKRIFYFRLAKKILVSSLQFSLDLKAYLRKNRLLGLLFRIETEFDRMGIFLPRLLDTTTDAKQFNCDPEIPHLLSISRITSWKGIETFIDISQRKELNDFHSVVLSTSTGRRDILDPDNQTFVNFHIFENFGVASMPRDINYIHIYAAKYPEKVKFPQCIGMNVLECLALGIPSVISEENFESWPELKNNPLVFASNWKDADDVVKKIRLLKAIPLAERESFAIDVRPLISISHHIEKLIQLSQLK